MVMQIKLVVVVVECLANDVLSGLVLFYSHFLLLLQPVSAMAFCCHFQ